VNVETAAWADEYVLNSHPLSGELLHDWKVALELSWSHMISISDETLQQSARHLFHCLNTYNTKVGFSSREQQKGVNVTH